MAAKRAAATRHKNAPSVLLVGGFLIALAFLLATQRK